MPDLEELAEGVRRADRRLLGRAVTLTESRLPEHRKRAAELLKLLNPPGTARRVGVTGAPGAGKSTLIEQLGLHAIAQGEKVAVLAIDPSSQRTGGSILGDKTRMERLAVHPDAYVRPSPAQDSLGGVARRTRECMGLFEAAGYTTILVETVGVGQSETAVDQLVDTVMLVALPGAGDELQGIKRGLMETADVVFVNKADSGREKMARLAATQLSTALRLLAPRTPGWMAPVLEGSAQEGRGVAELWAALEKHRAFLVEAQLLGRRRDEQAGYWLDRQLQEGLWERFQAASGELYREIKDEVVAGRLSPEEGAERLFSRESKPDPGG